MTMRLTVRLASRLLGWLEVQKQADPSLRGDVAQGVALLSAQKGPAGNAKSQVHPDKALDGWLVMKIEVVSGTKSVEHRKFKRPTHARPARANPTLPPEVRSRGSRPSIHPDGHPNSYTRCYRKLPHLK